MSLLPGTDRASTRGSSRRRILHDQVNAGEVRETCPEHSGSKANRQFIEAGNRAVGNDETVTDHESWDDEREQGNGVFELHVRLFRGRVVRLLATGGTNDRDTRSTIV